MASVGPSRQSPCQVYRRTRTPYTHASPQARQAETRVNEGVWATDVRRSRKARACAQAPSHAHRRRPLLRGRRQGHEVPWACMAPAWERRRKGAHAGRLPCQPSHVSMRHLSNDVMHDCTPPASDVSTEMAPLAVGDLRRPLRNEYGRLGLKASSLTPPLPPTPTMLPTDESPPKRRLTPGKLPATSPTSESKPRGVFSTNPACSIISTPDMPAVNFPPRPCADISSTACRMPFLTPSDSATVSGVAPTVESSESSLPRRLAQL